MLVIIDTTLFLLPLFATLPHKSLINKSGYTQAKAVAE